VPRLVPLNPAVCPHCRKKETKRLGFSEGDKGSIWQCSATECGKTFTVPTLSLVKKPG
jgi:ribosomal protein L37AE/L43A